MDLSASTASTSFLHNSLRRPRAAFARPSRRILAPRAAYHDPEGLFNNKPVMEGLIDRNLMKKDMGRNAELAAQMSKIGSEERQTMVYRRQTRTPPDDHGELVEYFLSTVQADMEFEVARCRTKLTDDFFRYMDSLVGSLRFSQEPDEDRLAELETLRNYLQSYVKVMDSAVTKTLSAVDRMKKLLSAKDKKATIYEMAERNEIDQALMLLLQQNADAARAAGQEDAAKFMEKVAVAAGRFVVKPARSAAAQQAADAASAAGAAAATAAAQQAATGEAPAAAAAAAAAPSATLLLDPKAPAAPAAARPAALAPQPKADAPKKLIL